VAATL